MDDDDRDFRRSKKHDDEGIVEQQSKRPTAPISVSKGDGSFAGRKRKNEDSGTR